MNSADESQPYDHAIRQGIKWLTTVRRPDGSYIATSLAAHYKSPLLFAETDMAAEGNLTLDWIINHYMTKDGHFEETASGAAVSRFCDLYEDLWMAWGAARLGRSEVSRTTFDFCSNFFDTSFGGFRSTLKTTPAIGADIYDLRSTALAGLVAITMGELDVAVAAGKFAVALMDLQPDVGDKFLLVRDEHGNLIKSYPTDLARFFVIPRIADRSQTPLYYALGLGIILLAKLFEVTGETRFLTTAERYAAVCRDYGREVLRNHYSGKLGWAFRVLSRLTGKQEYTRWANQALEYLLETQLPSGAWSVPTLYARSEDQPLSFTIDRTAEYILWITYVRSEGRPNPGRAW